MAISEKRVCQNCQSEFAIDTSDFLFYEKIKVPAPTWCPECRLKRRMAFRNERMLYKRKDAFGNDIISIYSPEKKLTVYDQKYWWSDKWNPLDYGCDYDFSQPFFRQFRMLRDKFPLIALSNTNAINSEYCNVAMDSKDCYLISASGFIENTMYSNRILYVKDSMDLYTVIESQLCYDDLFCEKAYRLFFSNDCGNCTDSFFLYDCKNCSNCFGCVNLRNKSYCIFNQQYSKEEYLKKIEKFDLGRYSNLLKFRALFREELKKSIHRYASIQRSVDVTGDHIENSKNCHFCFDIAQGAEDCKFLEWAGVQLKDSYDAGPGAGLGSLMYEVFDSGDRQSYHLISTSVVYGSYNVFYSFNCHNSSNLFGCIGLRNKSYCILNKQYPKEEYEKLLPRLIEQMDSLPYIDKKGRIYKYGEFFPPELSPFAYNETIAQEYFLLTKEEAEKQGYGWKEPEERNYKITMTADQLPDRIKDVEDSMLDEIIECASNAGARKGLTLEQEAAGCTTAFKIIPQELQFYRKMNLPLPRFCPNCRHYQRIKQRNPLKLWHRKCQCAGSTSSSRAGENQEIIYQNAVKHFHGSNHCPNEFETSYAPDRPEIVYCEACYNAEVV